MHSRLKFLIVWSTREVVQHNMPEALKQLYPKADPSYIALKCLLKHQKIWMPGQRHFQTTKNTIKFLVAITLDKKCNFLCLLEPGDIVLADQLYHCWRYCSFWSKVWDISFYQSEKSSLSKRGWDMTTTFRGTHSCCTGGWALKEEYRYSKVTTLMLLT